MNSSHPFHRLDISQLASIREELPNSISTLSLCSMNSAKFSSVWVTSAMSWEVKANSMLRISSSCWSSFSSDQHETKAALKRSLRREAKEWEVSRYSKLLQALLFFQLHLHVPYIMPRLICRNYLYLWNPRAFSFLFPYNIWLALQFQVIWKTKQNYSTEPWGYMPEPGPSMSARMVRRNPSAAPNSVFLTIPTSHLWKLFLLLPRPAEQSKMVQLPNEAPSKSRRNPSAGSITSLQLPITLLRFPSQCPEIHYLCQIICSTSVWMLRNLP